ncbi:GntR family transcriptional regulator [Aminobacter aminovorans]|uniref:GntR family transcriptional regulator n=1 Tax=Aminobacter TaxID=31988 RepID=UPI0028560B55|nr:GntR family transcriptional regulator [Aminobacter aminovorans]MDR7223701.1 DNA-binding GntR family transcriptional regulator [Aminobacter aminovorans]
MEGAEQPKSARGNVQDKVLSQLRYGLMSGLFVPGQVFSLRKLAAVFGTSAMPVRESLSRLIAANALEELPNRSVRVPRLGARALEELFELRARVEGLAARIATDRIGAAGLQSLRDINQTLKDAHVRGAMGDVLKANRNFHFTLYGLTESSILLPMIEGLWLRSGPTMYFSLNSPGLWDTSTHLEIIYALEKKDPDAAEAAMRRDIMKSGQELIDQAKSGVRTGPIAELSDFGME